MIRTCECCQRELYDELGLMLPFVNLCVVCVLAAMFEKVRAKESHESECESRRV